MKQLELTLWLRFEKESLSNTVKQYIFDNVTDFIFADNYFFLKVNTILDCDKNCHFVFSSDILKDVKYSVFIGNIIITQDQCTRNSNDFLLKIFPVVGKTFIFKNEVFYYFSYFDKITIKYLHSI